MVAMTTAVIYARFSCSKQREASIEDQLRVCFEWCARERVEVVGTYCDYAMSGRTDDRPEFQRMVDNAGESDLVLVYAFDRFSRDPYDAPAYKARLTRKGVRVVSVTEPLPEGPDGILMDKIYEGFAAMESARTSRRTRRGMEGNALKCMHNGVRVYGYAVGEDGTYVVDEAEAAVVREVFARRIGGENVNAIARDLASRGVVTSNGNPVGYSFVYNMLHSEKYRGVYSWGGIRKEGGMPRIVEDSVYAMAQQVRSRKERASESWDDYALSGRCICGLCGFNLKGTSGRGRGGTKYLYYGCGHSCGLRPVRADWLESQIAAHLRLLVRDRATALCIATRVAEAAEGMDDAARLQQAQRSLGEAERGIANIMRAVEKGLDFDEVRDRLSELRLQKARSEADVAVLSEGSVVDVETFADYLQAGELLGDRELLDAFVWQVWLGEDDVTVVLNYSNEKRETARLQFPRGFDDFASGAPDMKEVEPGLLVGWSSGLVLVRFPRAA